MAAGKNAVEKIKVYTLMNVCTGNLLEAPVNNYGWWSGKPEKLKKRNWTIGQFQYENQFVLSNFILNNNMPDHTYLHSGYGCSVMWVKEDEIDELYASVAACIIQHYCLQNGDAKQNQIFGAFLFSMGIEVFSSVNVSTFPQMRSYLRKAKKGKQFLQFLDAHGMLQFVQYGKTGSTQHCASFAEIEVVSKDMSEIDKVFAYK